jgi:hypothetical protein
MATGLRFALILALLVSTLGACVSEVASDDSVNSVESALSFVTPVGQSSPFLYDSGTDCGSVYGSAWGGIHCCPAGMAMTGAHIGANKFKCAYMSGGLTDFYTGTTVRNGMVSCRFGFVMVGYYNGGPYPFPACATPAGGAQGFEYVDSGTSDGIMHVCREDTVNPGRYAMSGIHAGNNKLQCFR